MIYSFIRCRSAGVNLLLSSGIQVARSISALPWAPGRRSSSHWRETSHGNHTSWGGQLLIHLHFKLLFVSLKHLIGETRSLAELDVQELEVPTPMEVVAGAGARKGLSLYSSWNHLNPHKTLPECAIGKSERSSLGRCVREWLLFQWPNKDWFESYWKKRGREKENGKIWNFVL